VTLPLTDATRGLVDAEALGRLRRGAIVVNVGRGEVVDEPALLRALAGGQLGGAGAGRRLLRAARARQPVVGARERPAHPAHRGAEPGEDERICALFARNLRRFLAGEELEGCVGVAGGY